MSEMTPLNLLDSWETLPLPPRLTLANFNDGNPYRVIFRAGYNYYGLLTFKKAPDTKVYFGYKGYGYWYFSNKTDSTDFKYYGLTSSIIGNGVNVDWYSSNYNYLSTSYKCYTDTADSIVWSNFDIYSNDQSTILYNASTYDELSPSGYFQLLNVSLPSDVYTKVGESWQDKLIFDCVKDESSSYSVEFEETPQPFDTVGSYYIKGDIHTSIEGLEPIPFGFNLNIYREDWVGYPNQIPFPPQDGMQEVVVVNGTKGIILLTTTISKGIHAYFYSATRISWSGAHADGGYSCCAGTHIYKLVDNEWVFQKNDCSRTYQYPLYDLYINSKEEGVIYSSIPINDKAGVAGVVERLADTPIERLPFDRSLRPLQLTYDYPDPLDYLEIDQAPYVFVSCNGTNLYLFTIVPEETAGFRLEVRGNQSTINLYANCKMPIVKMRKYNASTGTWGDPTTLTNQTSFSTSYVRFDTRAANQGYSANDVIEFTTAPVVLTRSVANQETETFLRGSDFKITVDENSQPPVVNEIIVNASTEEPYDVDTKFAFDYNYTLEEGVKGLTIANEEWENKQSYYGAGTTPVRVRAQDNRGLWSDWKEIEINVEKPITSDEIDIYNLPIKESGEPYQHYFVAIREASSVNINSDIYCFAFDLKEGESVQAYLNNNSNRKALGFKKKANEFIEYSRIFLGYTKEKGWGSASIYTPGNYNSLVSSTGYVDFGVKDLSAKNIYVSTFPLYYDHNLTEYRVYPCNKPEFPLSLEILTSHDNVWTSDDVTIQATLKSNGNEWKNFHYKINGGEAIALSNESETLTFTESGSYQVDFYVYNSENVETKVTTQFKIDKENPVISVVEETNRIIFNANDEHSGLKTFAYRECESDFLSRVKPASLLNEELGDEWEIIKTGHTLTKPKYGGHYYYQLLAIDELGHRYQLNYTLEIPLIPIEQVVITPQPIELMSNRSYQLLPTISYLPKEHNESINEVSFESLSPELITITDGLLQAVDRELSSGQGQFKVTVSGSQTSHEVIAEVVVKPSVIYPTGLEFVEKEITIEPGEPYTPSPIFLPEDCNKKGLTYKSSDTSIVTFNVYNQILGRKAGTAIITATTVNGIEATKQLRKIYKTL